LGRIIAIVLLAPLVYLVAILAASEWGGEVVALETFDVRGRRLETSVWIVQMQGDLWLRASDPKSAWLQRIRTEPAVFVTRRGKRTAYQTEIFEDYASWINRAMREKYGWADQLISTMPMRAADEVVAVRLLEP
jgi:hypothetical protein